jgi:hypothetical protein
MTAPATTLRLPRLYWDTALIIDGDHAWLQGPAGYPIPTATGPRCGNCDGKRHASATAIRHCYENSRMQDEAAEADYRHEQYCERAWESRFSVQMQYELDLEQQVTGRHWSDTGHGEPYQY